MVLWFDQYCGSYTIAKSRKTGFIGMLLVKLLGSLTFVGVIR